ncbi:hypothetical protein MMC07_005330 [Pseudocyphellaria aurata]|nr:hypothetical protein [Pseudocyphellaria aurata]
MLWSSSSLAIVATCLAAFSSMVSSHTVITYPGWRGDNLHTTGNVTDEDFPSGAGLGVGLGKGENNLTYPFGMQWIYPCGGMPISRNRTLWPVSGGAIGIQPGWFPGHSSAFFYINLGEGNNPINYSLPMQSVFEITGPNNLLYNGSFCLPQVPLPVNYTAVIGNNATIQIIETAQHGAALYNCVDITFADPKDVPEVNESNCANTSNIGFELVFSTESLSDGPHLSISRPFLWLTSISLATIMAAGFIL